MMDHDPDWNEHSDTLDSADLPPESRDPLEFDEMDSAPDALELEADDLDCELHRLNPDMDEETLCALSKDVQDRTPREVELVDLARHPGYEDQLSFACDDVTGEALLDENGDLVQVPRNMRGSQRPDGALQLKDGTWDFRECKSYSGSSAYNNLRTTIREQSDNRYAALGDNQHTTFVIAANDLTVHDADRLQQLAQDCGCDLEFQTK